MKKIPVAMPDLQGNESKYVQACLDSTWISSNGEYIHRFEAEFANYCQVKYAIATNNGTTALHLALVSMGVVPGDEVIVPDLTYVASANVVRYCQATPVFVDCEPRTLNIDPAAIEAKITNRTKAIIVVPLYGHPVDMDPILELAEKHQLRVIEDAAEALGAEYKGRPVGSLGHCASFSFFGNKLITTGEGGMVITNDAQLAEKLRLYRGQGQDPNRRYWFPVVGYNYRMTNIAAAIGCAQLERVNVLLASRRQLAEAYNQALGPLVDYLELPIEENWAKHSYWMYTILLKQGGEKERDQLMAALAAQGIETRPVFYPMHALPPYKDSPSLYPRATICAARGINLPTHPFVVEDDVSFIAKALQDNLIRGVS